MIVDGQFQMHAGAMPKLWQSCFIDLYTVRVITPTRGQKEEESHGSTPCGNL